MLMCGGVMGVGACASVWWGVGACASVWWGVGACASVWWVWVHVLVCGGCGCMC